MVSRAIGSFSLSYYDSVTTLRHASLVSHADWSVNPSKRWIAVAILQPGGRWTICELVNVPNPSKIFNHLKSLQILPGCILSGFDFPIGLPYQYALKAGITDFLNVLPLLGQKSWEKFYQPAESASEISLYRPFYPAKPGGSRRSHLADGLGIPFSQLYRLCEVGRINRRAACPLFWTLGGQQVGKAAISGWRDLLTLTLSDPSLNQKIWPFSGSLDELCQPGASVIVETYPAEFYTHLGLSFSSSSRRSKRRRSDRLIYLDHLLSWASALQIDLSSSITHMLQDGFGDDPAGEDRFDAFVGLYGMINVILGNHPAGEPLPPHISRVEGWIFGQEGSQAEICDGRSTQ
jgi:hypothetical protein